MIGDGYFTSPLEFLISTLFSLYILAVMLRFLLGAVRADFYNPISQFLVRITNPLLIPLRKVIPSIGKFDSAAMILMIVLQLVAVTLVLLLRSQGITPAVLIIATLASLVSLLINVFMFAIIIQVIISWMNPGSYNPLSSLLHSLTNPLLRPIRHIIPPIAGIDLSPLFALIALQVLRMLLMPLLL
jgi:YggT family protein